MPSPLVGSGKNGPRIETYAGRKLKVEKGREWGTINTYINGKPMGSSSSGSQPEHLDKALIQLRREVDAVDERRAVEGDMDAYGAEVYQGAPDLTPTQQAWGVQAKARREADRAALAEPTPARMGGPTSASARARAREIEQIGKTPTTWINKRTGHVVANPSQVDIVRGDVVKGDSDAGRAAVEGRRERMNANLGKARQASTEKRASELKASTDPRDNSGKIKALLDGRLDYADLYRTAHAGPSGQRSAILAGRVRHTPDNPAGEYQVTDLNAGSVAGYVTSVLRNGEQRFATYQENYDGGNDFLGWADSLAHAADVLVHGEAAASSGGTLDARRISGRLFERNPARGKTVEELDREALDREISNVRESLTRDLGPQQRASAERRLARLEAEKRGEPEEQFDTPRVMSQDGGASNAPTTEANMARTTAEPVKPQSWDEIQPGDIITVYPNLRGGRRSNTPRRFKVLSTAPVSVNPGTSESFQAFRGEHRQVTGFYVNANNTPSGTLNKFDQPDAPGGKGDSFELHTRDIDNLEKAPAAQWSAPAARPGGPTLGVTESSKGRTTTITLPDGTTAQRTSKTRAYTHAVVIMKDNRAEATSLRADAAESDRFADALQAWLNAGADRSVLKPYRTGSVSISDMREDRNADVEYYLPGFEPVQKTYKRTRFGGGGTHWVDESYYSLPNFNSTKVYNYKAYGDNDEYANRVNGKTAWEVYGPEYVISNHREMAATRRAKAEGLDKGPAQDYSVWRWSQSLQGAMGGQREFSEVRNTKSQIVGVGGQAAEQERLKKAADSAAEAARKAQERLDAAEARKVRERASAPAPSTMTAWAPGVPLGSTDAQRAAAAPRKEGESDLGYSLRTAPTDDAARRILNGYSLPALNAILRDEGITVTGGKAKANIVQTILQRLRLADRDSRAFTRMVDGIGSAYLPTRR